MASSLEHEISRARLLSGQWLIEDLDWRHKPLG